MIGPKHNTKFASNATTTHHHHKQVDDTITIFANLKYEKMGMNIVKMAQNSTYSFANPKAWQKPKPKPCRLVL
jgi:hypothetical protein